MSQTQEATRGGPGDARIGEQHMTGPHGDKEIESANAVLWMVVGWTIVTLAVLFPFPWWGW